MAVKDKYFWFIWQYLRTAWAYRHKTLRRVLTITHTLHMHFCVLPITNVINVQN